MQRAIFILNHSNIFLYYMLNMYYVAIYGIVYAFLKYEQYIDSRLNSFM